MYCSLCNKAPATVHVTRIQNNQIKELHFCARCASQKANTNGSLSNGNVTDALNQLLQGISQAEPGAIQELTSTEKVCSCCGLTYNKFKEIGKLGCPECYQTFREELKHLLRRMHGSAQHLGKNPRRTDDLVVRDKKLWEMRKQLQKAVKSEDYELAARLRDLIQEAENN